MTPQQLIERLSAYLPQLVAALPVALIVASVVAVLNLATGRTLQDCGADGVDLGRHGR